MDLKSIQTTDALRRNKLRPEDFPLRAVGGNVLLRRVYSDTPLLLVQQKESGVLRLGEVVGLPSTRWTQEMRWWPPVPTPRRTPLQFKQHGNLKFEADEHWDPNWKPPEGYAVRPHPPPPAFTETHRARLSELKTGDLVVYNNARVYLSFRWETEDVLIYPGNWIEGVVDESWLADNPDVRRSEYEPA